MQPIYIVIDRIKQVLTKCYTQTHVFHEIRYLNELTKTLFRLFLSLSLDTQKLTLLLHEFRWHVLNLFQNVNNFIQPI